MQVNLTYFKQTGKYYSEGSYQTDKTSLLDIWDEIKEKIRTKTLPCLVEGHSDFIVLVHIPDHEMDHPVLFNIGNKGD